MRVVIHKFVLTGSHNEVALEADAVVLYADRDSTSHHPAVWVRRRHPVPTAPPARRVFHVIATGTPFDPQPSPTTWLRPVGLVQNGDFIWHVHEETAA